MLGVRTGWMLSVVFMAFDAILLNFATFWDVQLDYAIGVMDQPLIKPLVSYQVVAKEAVDYGEDWSSCQPGKFGNSIGKNVQYRNELQQELAGLTNFSITLDLGDTKILVLGDSVGMQIFHMLDMASGGIKANRTVLNYAFKDHISYGLSSTRNLGAMRTTGMFLRKNENKPLPNAKGGGWSRDLVQELLALSGADGTMPIGSFDVLIFRIPHGWLELAEITESTIKESLQMASELLGVRKVILMTLPFNNNVANATTREHWFKKNQELHALTANFQAHTTIPGIESLVLMDLAQLTNAFIQKNAAYLGYLSNTDSPEMEYLDVRLLDYREWLIELRPAAAHVCSGPLFDKPFKPMKTTKILCEKNAITPDGMHLCSNAYGGRVVAATGCLLQCLQGLANEIQACQNECNDRFMTLKPVQVPT